MSPAPVRSRWPEFDDEQRAVVDQVLRSGKVNYWTGEQGRAFEQEFAQFVGVRHAVALANGTLALELALAALDVGPGDEVVVPARTFIASASCVVARGARPVVVDVDPVSQTLSADTIAAGLTERTKAIVCVHLAGRPCDMDPILELARRRNLRVIEDCAQAHGAEYRGRRVGSLGDAAAFSFCQDKIMTTGGEGGMLVTDCEHAWRRAWSYKDHGKDYDAVHHADHPPGFRWLHHSFGSNWRMTEMQAALGRVQLRRLPEWLAARRRNAGLLARHCRELPALEVETLPADIHHAYYRFYAFVKPEALSHGGSRDDVMAELTARGVPCSVGSCGEIHREQAFASLGPQSTLPSARRLADRSLAFLVDHTLTAADMDFVGAALRTTLSPARAAA
ncbi:MAG: DegT/DnrJ/EryC1/StrS aminotransferase family protein [Pirellulales bacterium]|nr:DegT/DnrJ/EryC1/StrS aminotransferase family protein [Pirellulales bacterium]